MPKLQPMSLGGERQELKFAQSRPAQHAQDQFEGHSERVKGQLQELHRALEVRV